ncbi:MAG: hypothetical protein R3E68_07345 [Burkholderiaceae bacterium]
MSIIASDAAAEPARTGRQRREDVVEQPAIERDVPAPPELGQAGAQERVVEVDRQRDAEQCRDADRHQRVAGEVGEHLQREADDGQPVRQRVEGGAIVEHGVDQGLADGRTCPGLHREPGQEGQAAIGDDLCVQPAPGVELRQQFRRAGI